MLYFHGYTGVKNLINPQVPPALRAGRREARISRLNLGIPGNCMESSTARILTSVHMESRYMQGEDLPVRLPY